MESTAPDRERGWRPLGEILLHRGVIDALQLRWALEEQQRVGGRLGEILFEKGLISAVDVRDALAEQQGLEHGGMHDEERREVASQLPLGRLLIRRGHITENELDTALAEQQRAGGRLGRILVDRGSLSVSALAAALAEQQGLPPPTRTLWEAAQDETGAVLYELRDVDRPGRRLWIGAGLVDATDVALAIVEQGEPVHLAVVEVAGGRDVQVCWEYPPSETAAGEPRSGSSSSGPNRTA